MSECGPLSDAVDEGVAGPLRVAAAGRERPFSGQALVAYSAQVVSGRVRRPQRAPDHLCSRGSVAREDDGMVDRFEVETADGGSLTVWVEGRGPALVLVHGSLSDHTPFQPLIDELRDDVT